MSRRLALASAVLAATASLGCLGPGAVDRVYDGAVVRGRYVSAAAYSAFLRGAIAEASGNVAEATAAYAEAARLNPASPEPWTRIAGIGCRSHGGEAQALAQVEHAIELDAGYAPAWEIEARCLVSLGRDREAAAAAARAMALDPRADGANVLVSRLGKADAPAAQRDALLALTRTAADRVVAWDALATWAQAHGDVASWAGALRELARLAPDRRVAVARAAEELAGLGELGAARSVAAAAIDASEAPLSQPRLAGVLAVDEAIAREQPDVVRRRASRARVGLEEAAARALLSGKTTLGASLAAEVARADPTARGARLLVAVAEGRDLVAAASDARPGDAPVSAAALLVFGAALSREVSPAGAGAALSAIPHEPVLAGDDRTVRAAVELVSRGVLPASALPADGAVELAALGGGGAPAAGAPVDLRHEYLALALFHPDAPRARELGARLGALGGHDPLVASASALVHLAAGEPVPSDASRLLLEQSPGDPVVAATALRLAEKSGDLEAARQARETLMARGGRHTGVD